MQKWGELDDIGAFFLFCVSSDSEGNENMYRNINFSWKIPLISYESARPKMFLKTKFLFYLDITHQDSWFVFPASHDL